MEAGNQDANSVQADLIRSSGMNAEEWIGKYAARFRSLLESSPEYQEIGEISPRVKRNISNVLYH